MCYPTGGLMRQVRLAVQVMLLHDTRDQSFISSSVTSNNGSITYNEQKEFYWNIYTQG